MSRLGVNIDHIATLREARKIDYPDPFLALDILHRLKVEQVTCHLREDRRHIKDHDLRRIIQVQLLPVNMEMAATEEMTEIALSLKPHTSTLVPEKREEITTEGGLDCIGQFNTLNKYIELLKKSGIRVSLFIDPDLDQIKGAIDLGVPAIELHTGIYCEVFGTDRQEAEFSRLQTAARYAYQKGLKVFAGHGLNRVNLPSVVQIGEIEEYNIGHSIIARSIFVGLAEAVKEIQKILK